MTNRVFRKLCNDILPKDWYTIKKAPKPQDFDYVDLLNFAKKWQKNAMYSQEQIVEMAVETIPISSIRKNEAAIYFLVKGREIVYVGKASKIAARLFTHIKGDKDFDKIAAISIVDDLDDYEWPYICKFWPKYNFSGMKHNVPDLMCQMRELLYVQKIDLVDRLEKEINR